MVEIRKALSKDARALARIGIRVWEEFVESWNVDVDDVREHVHAVYHDGTQCEWDTILVAAVEGAVIGWIAREQKDSRVSFLAIDPDHEKKGAATGLLAGLEAIIVNDGFDHAVVELHSRNAKTVSFFRENGYEIVSREMKYSTTLLDTTEKLTMRKDLAASEPVATSAARMEAS